MPSDRDITYIIKVRDEASKYLGDITRGALAATAALTGIGFIVKQAIDFESSFAGIRKTVDATEEEFAVLESRIRGIAKETPVATDALNRIGELAGQLGVRGVDNLTEFIDTVAKIAVTTNLTEEVAATSFARIANITQEPIANVDRMASSVVDLGNNFATTESEIVEFATRMAGAGKIAGLTTAEIFGISAAFSSVGIEAEAGGTAIQKVLLDLNSQGKRGIGAFSEFVKGLADAGTDAQQVLEDLGFTEARVQRAFLSVAGAGGIMEAAVRSSTQAFAENQALTEEASKRFSTMASKIEILKNRLHDLAIEVGEGMMPILDKLNKIIEPIIEAIGKWIDEHPRLVQWMMVVAVIVAGLVIAIAGLTTVLMGVAAVFLIIMSPIGLVTIALVAIGVAIALVIYHWDALKEMSAKAVAYIIEKVQWFAEQWVAFFQLAWMRVKEAWDSGVEYVKGLWSEFSTWIVDTIMSPINTIRDAFTGLFDWISSKLSWLFGKADEAVSKANKASQPRQTRARAGGGMVSEDMTLVGERGPELVSLPRGSYVHTAQESRAMMGGVNINVNIGGSLIGLGKRELAQLVGAEVMRQLRPVLA